MTWAINLSLPYIDTEHGQNVLENMRKTLLDVFAAAEIGASAIVDDTILTNLNLNIITGKGSRSKNTKDPYQSKDLSILKYSVPEFISNSENLMNMINEITDAKIEDGGTGAFYIYLKKNKLTK